MAVDAVHVEPVSACISLLSGKVSANWRIQAPVLGTVLMEECAEFNALMRASWSSQQETEQGIYSLDQGIGFPVLPPQNKSF